MKRNELEHIDIELTKKCNLNCIHCSARAGKNTLNDELSLNEIKELLQEAKSLGLKTVGLTGGEPFLCKKKLMEVVDFCNELKTSIHIHTNGILVSNEDAERVSRSVSEITVALYGSNAQTHDSVTRVEGSMQSTMESLERLLHAGANVSVYTVPMKCNIHEIIPLLKKVAEKGVRKIRILSISPTGRAIEKFDQMSLNRDELRWLNQELEKVQKEITAELCAGFCTAQFYPQLKTLTGHDSCLAAENRLHINAYGTVFPCTASSGTEIFASGNLRNRDYTLSQIWNESPLLQVIRKFHSDPPRKCQECCIQRSCMSGCRVIMFFKYGSITIADPRCEGPIRKSESCS
jgi:radical SAM protein with 4Fe4S-binding SPASM domain